jgi:hypothetical protein
LGQLADSINRFPGLLCGPFLVPPQVMVGWRHCGLCFGW